MEIEISDVGPITDLTLLLSPGMNVLKGSHGAGKTTALNAVARAFGGEAPISVRDGAPKGLVALNGVTLLTVGRVNKQTGEAELSLASTSPVADLVEPAIKDEKAKERARIQALLRLVHIDVTDEAIQTLVDDDDNALDYLEEKFDKFEELKEMDIVRAADTIRRAMHQYKRDWEEKAAKAQGEIDATPATKPEVVTKVPVAQAQEAYRKAEHEWARVRGEVSGRVAGEQKRRDIEQNLGEPPDLGKAEAAVAEFEDALDNHADERQDIEKEIARLQGRLAKVYQAEEAAKKLLEQARQFLVQQTGEKERYERNLEILQSPVTGATEKDAEAAQEASEKAFREFEAAKASEAYHAALAQRSEAMTRRESALQKVDRYERLATGVTGRLSLLLDAAGVSDLTVEDEVLMFIHPDGKQEPFGRRSYAEKTSRALELLAGHSDPETPTVVACPHDFWLPLLPPNRAEVAREFKARNIYGLTEEPSLEEDGTLRVEKYEAQEA